MYVPPLIKDQQVKEKKGLPTCLTHFHLQALQTPFKKKILICLLVATMVFKTSVKRPLRRRLGAKAPLFRLTTPYRFKNHGCNVIEDKCIIWSIVIY
jgi:hypothetical protein